MLKFLSDLPSFAYSFLAWAVLGFAFKGCSLTLAAGAFVPIPNIAWMVTFVVAYFALFCRHASVVEENLKPGLAVQRMEKKLNPPNGQLPTFPSAQKQPSINPIRFEAWPGPLALSFMSSQVSCLVLAQGTKYWSAPHA